MKLLDLAKAINKIDPELAATLDVEICRDGTYHPVHGDAGPDESWSAFVIWLDGEP